jgi:hypothetical protein
VLSALHLADERLLAALLDLQRWWDVDTVLLSEAVDSCRTTEPPSTTVP